MDDADFSDGLARLENLIYPDLHVRVDPASRASQVGWGLLFNVLHQIEAVLYLHTKGCCYAVAPNRRVAMEFGLFLLWLAEEREKVVDVLNRSHLKSQSQLAKAMREHNLADRYSAEDYQVLVDTVAAELRPEPDERLTKVQPLLDEYGLGELKAYYQAESRFSHVSLTAVQAFCKEIDDDLGVWQRPRYEETVPCKEYCLAILHVSMQAYNELLIGKPWTQTLAQIAKDYGLAQDLPKRKSRR